MPNPEDALSDHWQFKTAVILLALVFRRLLPACLRSIRLDEYPRATLN